MNSMVVLSLKGLLELLAVFIGTMAALSLAKYLVWRSGACLPGIIPCK